jgi:hypothetical protein
MRGVAMQFRPLLRACLFALCFAAAFMAILKLMQCIIADSHHEAADFP